MRNHRMLPALALAGALAFGVAACGDDSDSGSSGSSNASSSDGGGLSGEVAGAGASSQEAAMQAWIAGFQDANPDTTVSYDPVGSGGGREQFVAGGAAFAGSDSALSRRRADRRAGALRRPGQPRRAARLHLADRAHLQPRRRRQPAAVAPRRAAQIFDQKITNWNDPAIAADNPDAQLPDQRITVVNRSDESGTTENFTEYLEPARRESDWPHEVSGDWPVKGGEAAEGTSGVVRGRDVRRRARSATPTPARPATSAWRRSRSATRTSRRPRRRPRRCSTSPRSPTDAGKYVFTYDVNRDDDDGRHLPADARLVRDRLHQVRRRRTRASSSAGLMQYIVSPEGQEAAAKAAGSAPISDSAAHPAAAGGRRGRGGA